MLALDLPGNRTEFLGFEMIIGSIGPSVNGSLLAHLLSGNHRTNQTNVANKENFEIT